MESGGGDKTGPSVVRVIEHYCNEFDMVPRWGVLYSTKQCPHQRYAGQVFVRRQATGHIFDRHYLAPMFPSSLAVKADGHGGGDGQQLDVFLDQLVAVDSTTTQSRKEAASTLKDKMATTVNARQAQQAQQAVPASDWTVYATDECEDERAARAGTAVSVRSLSRLWKYLDGGRG